MPPLSPESFLYRRGGSATSAAYEIWATAHRQYTILATCQKTDTVTRLYAFRCFVRLVMRYRAVLLVEGETCPLCRRDNRLNSKAEAAQPTYCCWFNPGPCGTGILNLLRELGDLVDQGEGISGLIDDFMIAQVYGDPAPSDILDNMYIIFESYMAVDVDI